MLIHFAAYVGVSGFGMLVYPKDHPHSRWQAMMLRNSLMSRKSDLSWPAAMPTWTLVEWVTNAAGRYFVTMVALDHQP